jgi:hypothetical protein
MTRTLIIILASLILGGCATSSKNAYIAHGQSKEEVCNVYDNTLSGNKLCRWNFQDMWIYDSENKTEIIFSKEVYGKYFVFENVTKPMKCPLPLPYLVSTCFFGDGNLKIVTADLKEVKRNADPKFMAEYKKELEEIELKGKAEAIKEAKRLKEREEYEKKVKLENLDKTYGKNCLTKKNNISDYNTCLFNQERVVLAEKQEQDRKVNKAKLEEQNKLSTMPPSERYAYTCEKTYGFKKGSDNFRDCVFKIMTTEYEMQRASDQRRIAELESKINNNSSNYNSELLEIERLKAKALQDQADAVRNRNQTDALMDLSRSLLNNNNRAPANVPNLPLNCRSVRVGNTVQTQCY